MASKDPATIDSRTSSLTSNKNYNVGVYQYPSGLGVNDDLQHYIAFYINVRGKSKFDKKDNTLGVLAENNTSGLTSEQAGNAVKNAGVALGGLAAASTVGKIIQATKKPGSKVTNIGKEFASTKGLATLATAAVAGATTLGQLNEFLKPDKKERLKDVITLHLQERPSVKYGINYADTDLGILAGFLSKPGSALDTQNFSEMAALAGTQIARLPSIIPGAGTTLSNLIGVSARVKTNPFREVLFESIDYRTFDFRYKFFPKSYNESRAVKNIIEKFRLHMHPELSANKFFYIYPSEFEIRYYYKNKENTYFNKITNCALTDMGVEYGGDKFSTFDDGSPTEIGLTLRFRELQLLTKEEVNNGF